MICKDTRTYRNWRDRLGIPGNVYPNIPRVVEELPDGVIETIRNRIHTMDVESMTRVLGSIRRRPVRWKPDENDKVVRGFFVVSHRPLKRTDVIAPGKIHPLMFKGGRCLQETEHWHYVFTVPFACKARDITIRDSLRVPVRVNVTAIASHTEYALEYIKAQLYPGSDIEDDSLHGYSDDYYIACGYRGHDLTINKYLPGGKWDNVPDRTVPLILPERPPRYYTDSILKVDVDRYGRHRLHYKGHFWVQVETRDTQVINRIVEDCGRRLRGVIIGRH